MPSADRIRIFQERLQRRIDLWRILARGQRRFSRDPRFKIEFVEQGFASRPGPPGDDTAVLQRICDAWAKAEERQCSAADTFQPHGWWSRIRQTSLAPVRKALASRDFNSLRRMYRNFFRDHCSTGLTGLPFAKIDFERPITKKVKQLYLIDTLHRLDVWANRIGQRHRIVDLTPPEVGNPAGISLDGVFVRNGSEDQHYCARRIIELLGSKPMPVVAEIGGGYGGMAGFLVRDHLGVTYVNFDLPETIALAAYYLLTAFPGVEATLYGEADLDAGALRRSRIILMPGFALPELPESSVDVAFNARILSDLSLAALHTYLGEIARTTRGYLLHLNRKEGSAAADAWFAGHAPSFKLVEKKDSEWNDMRTLHPNEMEYLYNRDDSDRG